MPKGNKDKEDSRTMRFTSLLGFGKGTLNIEPVFTIQSDPNGKVKVIWKELK